MTRAAIRGKQWCDVPRTLTIGGETHTIVRWAEVAGVGYNTFYYRIRSGMDPARAVGKAMYEHTRRTPRPGFLPEKKRHLAPVHFDVGHLPRWGSVQSLTFRWAA